MLGVLAVGMPLGFGPARAAGDPAGASPDAAEVLEKHIEAIGGRAALGKLETRVTKSEMDFKTLGFTAKVTQFQARSGNNLFRMTAEPIGTFTDGVRDGVAWELSGMTGPRVKAGAERAFARRQAAFDAIMRWRDLYEKAECAGTVTIDERPCYRLILTPKEGQPETNYYDAASYLLVKSEFVIDHPMGQFSAEMYPDDYRRVDGVLLPFKMRTVMPNDERLITTLSVKHNVDFPDDLFALPDEIQTLAAGSDGSSPAEEQDPRD
jgi:hypothetical protein